MLLTTTLLIAQAEAAADPSLSVGSIWDFIVKGGPMMIPIAIASFVALAVIIERLISLRKSQVVPEEFTTTVADAVSRNDMAAARKACEKETAPASEVFQVAIENRAEPIDRLEHLLTRVGDRIDFKLRKFLKLLSVIAGIAPLMGLLGTIFGMIRAFSTVASSAEAMGKTELLAKGIYEAMITTAAGLLVAIPVLIAYHLLSARVDRLMIQLDEAATNFVAKLQSGQKKSESVAAKPNRIETASAPVVATVSGNNDHHETTAPVTTATDDRG